MKKQRVLGVLAVLFMVIGVLAIAVGAWAVLAPSVAPDDEGKTATTTTTTTAPDTAPVNTPLTNEEKIRYNTEIEESLFHAICKVVDIHLRAFQYDTDYLANAESRSVFAWEVLIDDRDVHRVYEVDADGQLVTGAVSFRQTDYAALYTRLYGEDADLNALLAARTGFRLKDDRIFGSHVTGWGADPFVIKTTGFVYNDTTGLYELKADFLTKVQERADSGWYDVDYDHYVFPYMDPAVLEYPDEVIYAKMTMEFAKTDDGYIVKSLRFAHP